MNIYWEEQEYSGEEKSDDKEVGGTIGLTKFLGESFESRSITPKIVGGYDITGGNGTQNSIVFQFVKKPSWFRRTCSKFFLGWNWIDKKEEEKKSGLLLG